MTGKRKVKLALLGLLGAMVVTAIDQTVNPPTAPAPKPVRSAEMDRHNRCMQMGWEVGMWPLESNHYCLTYGIDAMSVVWYRKVVLRMP